ADGAAVLARRLIAPLLEHADGLVREGPVRVARHQRVDQAALIVDVDDDPGLAAGDRREGKLVGKMRLDGLLNLQRGELRAENRDGARERTTESRNNAAVG